MRIDINNCTLQEAMDYAVQRIVEQGGRCGKDEGGHFRCLYGDGNGRHCGVGWLLPEDDPALMKTRMGIEGLVIAKRDRLPQMVAENVWAMSTLQRFHDAVTRRVRESCRKELSCLGIDTSGPHWQAWIDMGEKS